MPYVLVRTTPGGALKNAIGPFQDSVEARCYAAAVSPDLRGFTVLWMDAPCDEISASTLAELLEMAERLGLDSATKHYAQRLAVRIDHDAAHLTPSERVDLFHAELSAARQRRAAK